ncbi:MAG: GGDEF domain-containing phosphodiesterase [Myxococcota bacterium]
MAQVLRYQRGRQPVALEARRVCSEIFEAEWHAAFFEDPASAVSNDGDGSSTSIGIALGEFDDTVEALLDRADAAMYRVKRGGRAAYTLGAHLPVDLERILVPGEMELMFQPKLDLDLGRVTGAEALLRWRELPPAELVPALEARGLMSAVGERVLRAALLEGHRWGRSSEFRIAVNLSSEQFDREGLPEEIEAIVAETGLPPDHLELEVTEDVILRDVNRSQGVLDRLRGIGARISLDDFSARSSLTDLARFPLDIIKLDRSLISGLAEAPAQRAIVAAVVNLARNLGIETEGEGVETFEEQASLRRLGVDAVQGFLLLGPMDPKGLTVWLADRDAAKG